VKPTFELSRAQRRSARTARRMMNQGASRAWRYAVARRLERKVRRQSHGRNTAASSLMPDCDKR
jgi:hypothetical protein